MKKVLGILMAAVMAFSLAACGSTGSESTGTTSEAGQTAEAASTSDIKIGAILVGDETEGYSAAHINGIKEALSNLGLTEDNVIWKYKVAEDSACMDAAEDLVGQGCDIIFANSYGHQTYMVEAAEKYPDVTFVSMTGDFAALTGLDNFKNAFTKVYESRYVSGVVAGMKLKELVESGELTDRDPARFLRRRRQHQDRLCRRLSLRRGRLRLHRLLPGRAQSVDARRRTWKSCTPTPGSISTRRARLPRP